MPVRSKELKRYENEDTHEEEPTAEEVLEIFGHADPEELKKSSILMHAIGAMQLLQNIANPRTDIGLDQTVFNEQKERYQENQRLLQEQVMSFYEKVRGNEESIKNKKVVFADLFKEEYETFEGLLGEAVGRDIEDKMLSLALQKENPGEFLYELNKNHAPYAQELLLEKSGFTGDILKRLMEKGTVTVAAA